jgi:hypothetical protein
MAKTTATQPGSRQATDKPAIREFQVDVPEAELAELRRRINATRWPERETVADQSQGVQLATIQELARLWATAYDWRKCEAKLNALPQFLTEIDGLDIHFIHVRSRHDNALPLIVTHGWPGSIIEELKVVDPLTNPTAHGGSASDAFHLVIPSMPGYGFSGKPARTCLGRADESSRLLTVCGFRRRLGGDRERCDGYTSASGVAGDSLQYARRDSSRDRQSRPERCTSPVRARS